MQKFVLQANQQAQEAEKELTKIYTQNLQEIQKRSQFYINLINSLKLGFERQEKRIQAVLGLVGGQNALISSFSGQNCDLGVPLFNDKIIDFELEMSVIGGVQVKNNYNQMMQNQYEICDQEGLLGDCRKFLQYQADLYGQKNKMLSADETTLELQKSLGINNLDFESLKKKAREELKIKLEMTLSQRDMILEPQNSPVESSQLDLFAKASQNINVVEPKNLTRNNSLLLSADCENNVRSSKINIAQRVSLLFKKANYKPEIIQFQDIPQEITVKYFDYITICMYQYSKIKNDLSLKIPSFEKRRNYNSGNMLIILYSNNQEAIVILLVCDKDSCQGYVCKEGVLTILGPVKTSVSGIENEIITVKGRTVTIDNRTDVYEKGAIFDIQ